jgi:LPXTG-motif cell wall-anchored protein
MDVAGQVAQAAGIAPGLPSGDYAVSDVESGASETAGQPTDETQIEDAAKTTAFPAIGIAAVAGIGLFLLMKRK